MNAITEDHAKIIVMAKDLDKITAIIEDQDRITGTIVDQDPKANLTQVETIKTVDHAIPGKS
jgi:hypothetical protein